jgi:chromosome partitioning protein
MGTTYNSREAAVHIGIHELTLRRWELEGKTPKAHRNLRGNRFYTEEDIRNLVTYKNTGLYGNPSSSSTTPFEIAAFVNQKGGVAKTTTSVNLAAAFAKMGKKVLIADLDPQGHAGLGLGIDIHGQLATMYDALIEGTNINDLIIETYVPNLYVAPSNIQLSTADLVTSGMLHRNILLKKSLRQLPSDFDLVILDCPPTIGILTYNALIACTQIYVPVEMDFYALEGMSQLIDTINLVNEVRDDPIDVTKVIITKFESNTKINQAALSSIQEFFGDRVCKTFIRKNTTIREAPSEGKAILDYAPNSSGASDYWKLAQEILGLDDDEVAELTRQTQEAHAASEKSKAEKSFTDQETPVHATNGNGETHDNGEAHYEGKDTEALPKSPGQPLDTQYLDSAETEALPKQSDPVASGSEPTSEADSVTDTVESKKSDETE